MWFKEFLDALIAAAISSGKKSFIAWTVIFNPQLRSS